MTDDINSPRHYTQGGYESIEMIEDQGHGEGFCYGNALKYIHRARFKGEEIKDLQKAIWYLERRIRQVEHGVKAGTFVPAPGSRVAGQVKLPLYDDYYKWDGNKVTGYCDQCDVVLYQRESYIEHTTGLGDTLRFCSQSCHDRYLDFWKKGED